MLLFLALARPAGLLQAGSVGAHLASLGGDLINLNLSLADDPPSDSSSFASLPISKPNAVGAPAGTQVRCTAAVFAVART